MLRTFGIAIVCTLAVGLGSFAATNLVGKGVPMAISSGSEKPGPQLDAVNCIRPADVPGSVAVLKMGGLTIPVDVHANDHAGEMTIRLVSKGETIDQERYQCSEKAFLLSYAAGERFSPPLPLMTFPMNVGDRWDWTGEMHAQSETRKARAKVTSEVSKADVGGRNMPSVKVEVKLEILPENSGDSIKRSLTFWMVEGKGVVRREFGDESVRESAPR